MQVANNWTVAKQNGVNVNLLSFEQPTMRSDQKEVNESVMISMTAHGTIPNFLSSLTSVY